MNQLQFLTESNFLCKRAPLPAWFLVYVGRKPVGGFSFAGKRLESVFTDGEEIQILWGEVGLGFPCLPKVGFPHHRGKPVWFTLHRGFLSGTKRAHSNWHHWGSPHNNAPRICRSSSPVWTSMKIEIQDNWGILKFVNSLPIAGRSLTV